MMKLMEVCESFVLLVASHAVGFYINPLTTDDAIWRRQILAACYQLARFYINVKFTIFNLNLFPDWNWEYCTRVLLSRFCS